MHICRKGALTQTFQLEGSEYACWHFVFKYTFLQWNPSTRNSFQQSFSLSSVWKTCLCVEKGVHSEQPLRLFVNFGTHRRNSHYFKKRLYFKWEKVLISPEKDFLVVFLLKTKTINSNVLREVWEYWTGALKLPLEWPTFIPAMHD